MMNFRILLFSGLLLGLISCGEKKPETASNLSETPVEIIPVDEPSADMAAMQMQKWEITDLIYDNDGIGVFLEKKPYIIFREGRASGFAGCNSFMGKYIEGENNGIDIQGVAGTKKMCPEGNRVETRLLELLESAYGYELNENKTKLKIKSPKGQINCVLR